VGNKKGGSSRMVIFGLLLILIGGFLFLDFLQARKGGDSLLPWPSLIDYGAISRKIYFSTGEALAGMGISNKNLILQYPEEKKEGKREWIHFTSQIRVPATRSLQEYRDDIKKAVEKVGGRILSSRTFESKKTQSLMMTIGIKTIATYSLTLEQPKKQLLKP